MNDAFSVCLLFVCLFFLALVIVMSYMNKPIRGVAFDLDGLLIDSESLWREVHEIVFSRHGIPYTDEDHKEYYIRTSRGTTAILTSHGLYHLLDKVRAEMNELRIIYTTRIKFMQGANEIIDLLYPHLPLGIVTYSPRESAEYTCDYLGISGKIKFMVTRFDVENQKPHSEPYLRVAELMGIDPSEMVAFEDAAKGVISAKDAGMKCVAVPNEWTEGGDFSRADLVVRSLRDVNLDMLHSI